jgi:hypothetical protein
VLFFSSREGRTVTSVFRHQSLASFDAAWKEVLQIKTLFIVGQVR